jgi:hypothetical protein
MTLMGMLSGSADNRSAGVRPARAGAVDAILDRDEWHAEDPVMISRAMNGRFKTMQEMLGRVIGPASGEALHGKPRACERNSFSPGAQRSLEKALHRACGAPVADERLSLRPAASSRLATVASR